MARCLIPRPAPTTAVRPAHAVVTRRLATLIGLLAVASTRAYATGPAMPWDGPLDNLLQNLSGPTARALVLVAIVATGLLWALTRNEEGVKRVGQIAFGGAIAMGAVTLFANLGLTAGALL